MSVTTAASSMPTPAPRPCSGPTMKPKRRMPTERAERGMDQAAPLHGTGRIPLPAKRVAQQVAAPRAPVAGRRARPRARAASRRCCSRAVTRGTLLEVIQAAAYLFMVRVHNEFAHRIAHGARDRPGSTHCASPLRSRVAALVLAHPSCCGGAPSRTIVDELGPGESPVRVLGNDDALRQRGHHRRRAEATARSADHSRRAAPRAM